MGKKIAMAGAMCQSWSEETRAGHKALSSLSHYNPRDMEKKIAMAGVMCQSWSEETSPKQL